MYYLRVEPGMELIQVPSGIVPTYRSAAISTMNKRLRVVPGYVFTSTKKAGAERVPDNEWKVIEAISSTFPSTLDVTTARISDGPLKDLLLLQIDPTIKAVLIRAKLLGETRDYWLPVWFADGTEKNKAETEKKPKPVYTDEKRAEMLAKAEEVGVMAAAKAYGVPWQTFAQLKRWAAKSSNSAAEEKKLSRSKKEPKAKNGGKEYDQALIVENAIIKERIAKLEVEIVKLKKVVKALM